MTVPLPIQIAQTIPCTQAEGPGKRFAIWVQGCPLRCAHCCNPEMLSYDGGTSTPVETLLAEIEKAREQGIEGITLIGGEPFAHADSLAVLSQRVREVGLSVMVFTGLTLAEIRTEGEPASLEFLRHIDLLVDGPYDHTQPDTERRWIGSRNQEIHFLTDRYRADDPVWSQRDTLEVRWDGEEILVNGFPARSASSLWKRERRS